MLIVIDLRVFMYVSVYIYVYIYVYVYTFAAILILTYQGKIFLLYPNFILSFSDNAVSVTALSTKSYIVSYIR